MAIKHMTEKSESTTTTAKPWSAKSGYVVIVALHHILLWCSLYVTTGALYAVAADAVFPNDVPSIMLFIVAGVLSLAYIGLQNVATRLRTRAKDRWQSERADTCQALAQHLLRILFTVWMVTCGLSITFTAAGHPLCEMQLARIDSSMTPLDVGSTCIVNRVGIIIGCIDLITCGGLFILVHKVNDSFRAHLFGIIKEQDLMPLYLPYRNTADQRLCSEMSFKCRSSASLSSKALHMPWSASTSFLVDSKDRHAQRLDICTAHRSGPSRLSARPSPSSIRSHASFSLPPPLTSPLRPLPPLPVHKSTKYRAAGAIHSVAMQKAVYPPRPTHGLQFETIIRPTLAPALSTKNLAVLNRDNNISQQSLSSIYSRSISGEQESPLPPGMVYSPNVGARLGSLPRKPSVLSFSARSTSSTSTATLKRSPLGKMTLAKEHLVGKLSIRANSVDVDRAVALQRRLRLERNIVKASLVKTSELEGYVDRQSGLSHFNGEPLM
ncbi:hypothetical protein DOTSEDRAFT_25316 [Dothistroma septosporum NZE10]|uniref:Transmembrane protein n=1 Tax=Dothistroma septosporum (strain NZE10 / CBS 128990) TaxID=675120 RepID=M2YN44_DOTSN|nr:hypothetical protein DOTSEDRAFT_25316 [Dothistroma septosporum NZE10]